MESLMWVVVALALAAVGVSVWRVIRAEAAARRLFESMRDVSERQLADARQARTEQAGGIAEGFNSLQERMAVGFGALSQSSQTGMDSFASTLRVMRESDERRMDRLSLSVEERLGAYDRQMERVARTLDSKLDEMRRTVGEKLDATLTTRLDASFQRVSERLEQVHRGLGEMRQLAQGVGDLKKVMTNVKARGIWGEAQLGALLSQVFAPGQYESNAQVKSGAAERVEFAVKMPGRDGSSVLLPIDSKFPLEDYRRLVDASEAGDLAAIDEASRSLDQALLREGKRIRSKYVNPPVTTDFAILFVPVEGLYAEALRRAGTVERLQREFQIVVTGPTTLFALLQSLQMGFRTLAIEKRSNEVWRLLGAVRSEFEKFSTLLDKTQSQLQQAATSIEGAAKRSKMIQKRLSDVQAMPEEEATLLLDEAE
ncbi:MAG: DNA recombination protein RmuC [Oscillospiraceae bacterium]|jgi:DNA recombination protein RmuC|nr:DNA recombination protein RmuC [Oscillospiraceae bacterium]